MELYFSVYAIRKLASTKVIIANRPGRRDRRQVLRTKEDSGLELEIQYKLSSITQAQLPSSSVLQQKLRVNIASSRFVQVL